MSDEADIWGNTGEAETCMTCDGSGLEYGETCVTCGGLGFTCWPEEEKPMTDLIARIESADGPDRELFEAALKIVLPRPEIDWLEWTQDRIEKRAPEDRAAFQTWLEWDKNCQKFRRMLDAEAWTSAAELLVPEGWRSYAADMSIAGRTRFLIEGLKTQWATDDAGEKCAGADWYAQGVAATPALALAAAALKARGV